jgi:hypothetical protein
MFEFENWSALTSANQSELMTRLHLIGTREFSEITSTTASGTFLTRIIALFKFAIYRLCSIHIINNIDIHILDLCELPIMILFSANYGSPFQ